MQLQGIPERFWVVTRPSPASQLEDILFSCTIERLMHQARGGLRQADILGIYADEGMAVEMAKKLLGEWTVGREDSLAVEVLVHVLCHPTTAGIAAKALAQAVVEGISNALHEAEEAGFHHQLLGEMRMGIGEVELNNQFTLFG